MTTKVPSSFEPAVSSGASTTRSDDDAVVPRAQVPSDRLRADFRFGPARLRVTVDHTPAGLIALGGCVSSILLGAAAIVWVSTASPRRHPLATALALRGLRKR